MKKVFLLMLVMIVTIGMLSAATITVTKPASGETVTKGSPYTIQWTKSGAQDASVKIRLYNPAGTTKILDISNSTANDGNFSWPVPNSVANGSYVVRVKTLDNATWDDSGVFTIAAVSVPGTIVVDKPAAGNTVIKGGSYTIEWTKTGAQDASVKIRLYNPAGTTKILDITNSTANDGRFSWPVANSVAGGSYVVRVKTLDNVIWDDSGVFTIASSRGGYHPDWGRLKDILKGMTEIPWWRNPKGPWPGPNPCLSCPPWLFDMSRIRDIFKKFGVKEELTVEIVKNGKVFGKQMFRQRGLRLMKMKTPQVLGMQKFRKQNNLLLKRGTGFKLLLKNKMGKILAEVPINLKEKNLR